MNSVYYSILKPLFWIVTVLVGLGLAIWLVVDNRHTLGNSSVMVLILFQVPVFFGVAAVCGWLTAVASALLRHSYKAAGRENTQTESRPGIGRFTAALMIGSCFATTVVWGSGGRIFSLDLSELAVPIWASAFLSGSFITFMLMRFLALKQQRESVDGRNEKTGES